MENRRVIAVIPARGGSRGLPGKNIKHLCGKPLIAYTIEAALKSKLIDRVIVSTDSEEIARISRQFGAEVPFIRPGELATDTAHTGPVIKHAVKFIEEEDGKTVDIVVTLQPTSPLRASEQIDEAISKIMKVGADSVMTVKEAFPPWWLLKEDGDKALPLLVFKPGINPYNVERQEFPKVFQANGAVYVTHRNYLFQSENVVNIENNAMTVMDEESSLDIDNLLDFQIIEHVLKNKRGTDK